MASVFKMLVAVGGDEAGNFASLNDAVSRLMAPHCVSDEGAKWVRLTDGQAQDARAWVDSLPASAGFDGQELSDTEAVRFVYGSSVKEGAGGELLFRTQAKGNDANCFVVNPHARLQTRSGLAAGFIRVADFDANSAVFFDGGLSEETGWVDWTETPSEDFLSSLSPRDWLVYVEGAK